jgi:hypothetical protein
VVSVFATGTEDRWFESRQGVRILGLDIIHCNTVDCNLIRIVIVSTYLSERNVKKYFKRITTALLPLCLKLSDYFFVRYLGIEICPQSFGRNGAE